MTYSCTLLVSLSLQELQREKNSITVQLDQSSRRLSQLEEEKKSSEQSIKRTQGLLDDIKGTLVARKAVLFDYFHDVISLLTRPLWLFSKVRGTGRGAEETSV